MINKKDTLFIRLLQRIYKSKIFNPVRKYGDVLRDKIERSVRFELMVVIAICFASSFIFYGFMNNAMKKENKEAYIQYNYDEIKNNAEYYVGKIQNAASQPNFNEEDFFNKIFNEIDNSNNGNAKAYITDLDGNVLRKSANVVEDKIDIFNVIGGISNIDSSESYGGASKNIYPIKINEDRMYFLYEDTPSAYITYRTYELNKSYLALILSFLMFIILFIIITNSKMKYVDEIGIGLKNIAGGNLNYRIRECGNDEIRKIAANINYMAEEISKKILAERNAEKTKADLITNVSHDLRTPLTSIMGYIGLVKDGRYDSEETKNEYLNIAFNKSEKLKVLIEDLFEYTKLNNDGIKINRTEVNINEFLFQLIEELMPIFEENNLKIIKSSSRDKIHVDLDPDKMLRVFENLFTNAIKYSYKPGEISVSIYESEGYANIVIRNKGQHIPKEKIDRLFDRFYRVDESRNAETGGSGLGLAISKNIVELHEGKIYAECYGEDISFVVKLKCKNNNNNKMK